MRIILFSIIGFLSFLGACKSKPVPVVHTVSTIDTTLIANMWKKIDSLEQKGLTTSALEEVRKIKSLALQGNDSGHLIKAIVHENKYLISLEEDSAIKALQRIESEIDAYPEPARSVMHSLAGQWYGQYLQTHLWELRNRTEFMGEAGPDIRTWGMRHFVDRISEHYSKSVQWDGLKTARVEDYKVLLTEAQHTDELRPTLYDILMHRALDFYAGSPSYLTNPSYQFVLDDVNAFDNTVEFVKIPFETQDTVSNLWRALKGFQELLKYRLSDEQNEAALIDADVKRLRFVYDHSLAEGKDSIYINALNRLSQKYSDNPESTLIDYYRAEWLMQKASEYSFNKESKHRYDYKKAMEICREAIRKYPTAYGSQLCKNLITQIESKSISGAVESVNLPSEELLAQIEYRNLSSVNMKIVKLPESPVRWRGENFDGDDLLKRLNALSAIKSWTQNLNTTDDYQPHITEVGLPALSLGHYALVISDMPDYDVQKSTTGAIMFTVSQLGYWYIDDRQDERSAAIINRKTGLPEAGVKAEFFYRQYNSRDRRQDEIKLSEATSDANGWVAVPHKENQSISIRLTKGSDELYEEQGFHSYRIGRDYSDTQSTLFFADRSIYRPGQKIYFKGYVLAFDKNRVPEIVPGKNVEIVLHDANGQEVMRKNFIANPYGTIAGHFDLPTGGLTGQMSLSSSHGSNRHYFQVEEYKRPKFEVTFDTLKETARLNQEVTIRGYAKDFAGSPVSAANVGYRVERVSYTPWWFGYYRKGFWPREDDRQVLTQGNAITGNDGSFVISYIAKPKPGGDKNLMYRFETTVYVTDVTGESHEQTKILTLNEQGFDVNISIDEREDLDELGEIVVTAINSDGAEVNITGDVDVQSLVGPSHNKRERLWSAPDIMTITEAEYAQRFVNYFIPGKESMQEWSVAGQLGKRTFSVSGKDTIRLNDLITQPGYYRLTWKWKDASGKVLEIIQNITVYASNKPLPGKEIIQVHISDRAYQPGDVVETDLYSTKTSK